MPSAAGASFLAVLKRFGPANPAPLSFPPGMDARPRHPGGRLDVRASSSIVSTGRGRGRGPLYLAKDSRLRPELFP